jgi:antitoxin (DNA-binding transcriptional repressor) of toxin-antitoxin stability system
MMRVELNEATDSLSEYTRKARKEPVVVTRHGKPVAMLRALTEDEWEDFVVSTDPRFIAMIERSRARFKPGAGIPLADVMRKYGIKPNASRRTRKAR